MRMLLTNCPNCAGELEKGGYCRYCNTHVRMANELDINSNDFNRIELMLNIKRGNETLLIPCVGYMADISVKFSPHSYKEIEFTFNGYITDNLA